MEGADALFPLEHGFLYAISGIWPRGAVQALFALELVGEGLAVELPDRGVGVGHHQAIGALTPQARSGKPLGSKVARVELEHVALCRLPRGWEP